MKKNGTKTRNASRAPDEAHWRDIVGRNAAKDGIFVYSVRSTGVYCQPSCASRTPARENVRIHDSSDDAEREGFRACRRCRPDLPPRSERHAAIVADLCRRMEDSDEPLGLRDLAEAAGMSMYYLHRVFKSIIGVTPKAYADEVRNRRMRSNLGRRGSTVTSAIYGSGYGSSSRFYEKSTRRLGMTPTNFRRGGANASIVFSVAECWLGHVLVAASEKGICAITMGGKPEPLIQELHSMFPGAESISGDRDFDRLVAKVVSYIERPVAGLDLPLDVQGTAFQQRVWKALLDIPSGTTVSYAELAGRIGSPRAVRAVARACASNRLAVAIPCHRVVRSDGGLSGYRWEEKRKKALLGKEKELAGS